MDSSVLRFRNAPRISADVRKVLAMIIPLVVDFDRENHLLSTQSPYRITPARLRYLLFRTYILSSAFSTLCGVNGISVTRPPKGNNASLIAFITAPGAPAVPASPTPLAPNSEVFVFDST